MKRIILRLFIMTFVLSLSASAQQLPKEIPGLDTYPPKPKVMILGTFPFAKPALDYTKAERDSILSPKRQKEVRELIDKVKAFKPTKIAIESPYGTTSVNDNYNLFLQDTFD